MNTHHIFCIFATSGLLLGACVHTPPGTSVEFALAKKAQLIRLPTPPASAAGPMLASNSRATYIGPAVEPELPLLDDRIEAVAEAYTRGKFALEEGKDAEAISAFQEVVKLDPTHVEAWQSLAFLYEKTGDEKKSLDAFRHAKKIAAS